MVQITNLELALLVAVSGLLLKDLVQWTNKRAEKYRAKAANQELNTSLPSSQKRFEKYRAKAAKLKPKSALSKFKAHYEDLPSASKLNSAKKITIEEDRTKG